MADQAPVWVVSPHLLVAQAVAAALSSVGTPAEAHAWESAVRDREAGVTRPGHSRHVVAILDGVEAGDVVEQVTALVRGGDVRIVVVTTDEGAVQWGGLLATDAVDVATTTTSVVQLAEVVESLVDGTSSMDPSGRLALQASWARALARRRSITAMMATLSPQQRRVLELLASGRRVAEVGDTLGVAHGTVRSHVKALRAKLGARNQLEAVAMWHQISRTSDGSSRVPRPRRESKTGGVTGRR
ncbi:DNA-binding response regulator, NarL/FixJ family, contains REC and HTH domains [Nocardioides exalbidus]|uniref:DNA-binding response regulator, NarL/FixJ family, contains REC and HTH domains n=1 Tax=Nocardioides exalbidus TaxID=402596 RepID=A0A1H4KBZ0_9ACTN|nr:LuxR C-terminal-related transcriptional regulator [Nocardioides exalbidus]SEB56059.1 DNA-binding response regulator, NarL/FixJ family, contains REC and HTH domains [Nocardioides exalbidus]